MLEVCQNLNIVSPPQTSPTIQVLPQWLGELVGGHIELTAEWNRGLSRYKACAIFLRQDCQFLPTSLDFPGGSDGMSDSVRPHRWHPTRLPRPWDSPSKDTGVGCHCLLQCTQSWTRPKRLSSSSSSLLSVSSHVRD